MTMGSGQPLGHPPALQEHVRGLTRVTGVMGSQQGQSQSIIDIERGKETKGTLSLDPPGHRTCPSMVLPALLSSPQGPELRKQVPIFSLQEGRDDGRSDRLNRGAFQ